MTCTTHGDDWRGPDGECEARFCTDIITERRAVLLGYEAIAALRAEKEQHARLGAAARERERRLVDAIRKASR